MPLLSFFKRAPSKTEKICTEKCTNGYTNGYSNGYSNGLSNGGVTKPVAFKQTNYRMNDMEALCDYADTKDSRTDPAVTGSMPTRNGVLTKPKPTTSLRANDPITPVCVSPLPAEYYDKMLQNSIAMCHGLERELDGYIAEMSARNSPLPSEESRSLVKAT